MQAKNYADSRGNLKRMIGFVIITKEIKIYLEFAIEP